MSNTYHSPTAKNVEVLNGVASKNDVSNAGMDAAIETQNRMY